MDMINENETKVFLDSFQDALKSLSNGRISEHLACEITSSIKSRVDLNNESLLHRGARSLAKDILSALEERTWA